MTLRGCAAVAVLVVMVILLFTSIALWNINFNLVKIARTLREMEDPISSIRYEIRNSGHDIEKELKGVELTIDDLYEKLFTNAQVTIIKEDGKWGEVHDACITNVH